MNAHAVALGAATSELRAEARYEVELRETIAAYDQTAHEYAARFSESLLKPYLDHFVELLNGGGRVLDAGCGHGRDCAALERLGVSVVGADLSQGLLRQAHLITDAP